MGLDILLKVVEGPRTEMRHAITGAVTMSSAMRGTSLHHHAQPSDNLRIHTIYPIFLHHDIGTKELLLPNVNDFDIDNPR